MLGGNPDFQLHCVRQNLDFMTGGHPVQLHVLGRLLCVGVLTTGPRALGCIDGGKEYW
jgi:hypothetical protein